MAQKSILGGLRFGASARAMTIAAIAVAGAAAASPATARYAGVIDRTGAAPTGTAVIRTNSNVRACATGSYVERMRCQTAGAPLANPLTRGAPTLLTRPAQPAPAPAPTPAPTFAAAPLADPVIASTATAAPARRGLVSEMVRAANRADAVVASAPANTGLIDCSDPRAAGFKECFNAPPAPAPIPAPTPVVEVPPLEEPVCERLFFGFNVCAPTRSLAVIATDFRDGSEGGGRGADRDPDPDPDPGPSHDPDPDPDPGHPGGGNGNAGNGNAGNGSYH